MNIKLTVYHQLPARFSSHTELEITDVGLQTEEC